MKRNSIIILQTLFLLFPLSLFAQQSDLNIVVINLGLLIQNAIIPLLMGLALLVFLWGILKYLGSRDDESRKESIQVMIYGIIGLFVMTTLWGLIWLISEIFGLNLNNRGHLPPKNINTDDIIVR